MHHVTSLTGDEQESKNRTLGTRRHSGNSAVGFPGRSLRLGSRLGSENALTACVPQLLPGEFQTEAVEICLRLGHAGFRDAGRDAVLFTPLPRLCA